MTEYIEFYWHKIGNHGDEVIITEPQELPIIRDVPNLSDSISAGSTGKEPRGAASQATQTPIKIARMSTIFV